MNDVNRDILFIVRNNIIVLLILMIASLFFSETPLTWIRGYVFGGSIGILNFLLLAKTIGKAVKMKPENARTYAASNYFIRYIIIAIVIAIALKAEYINSAAVIIALTLNKTIILITNIFNDKKYFMRILGKREE